MCSQHEEIVDKKALVWARFSGRGACLMASTFSSVGEILLAEMTQAHVRY